MKKLLTLTILICLAITGSALAQDTPEFSPFNLNADTLYFPTTGQVGIGVGYTVATFKEMFELRVESAYIATGVVEGDKQSFLGAGAGINVKKAIEKAGGSWAMSSISPTVGLLFLYDATAQKKLLPAIYVSLIKLEF